MRVCCVCSRCFPDTVRYCLEEDHPELSQGPDGDPEMIRGYQLEAVLESGTQCETYRTRESSSGTPCIVRIISADHPRRQRFLDDAKIAATLFHPNVADVYEAGILEKGDVFVVAEDAGCETLRDRLQTDGVPPLSTSISIIRQAAEALHALHLRGLTHGALKPENILLTAGTAGHPLVRIQHPDFGGAGEHSIVSNRFLIDSSLEKLRYFAPEQFEDGTIGPRTDIYGLGIIFYEILTGVPPFDASKASALIEMHREQQPPDVKIDDFNLRMLVTHALSESLQKSPSLRQTSANLFARQLRHIEQLSSHVSTPPPAGVAPPEPRRALPRVSVALDPAVSATTHPYVIATPVKASCDEPFEDAGKTSELDLDELFGAIIETNGPIVANAFVDRRPHPDATVEELALQGSEPRRSRLKLHRKRLRSTVVSRNEIPMIVPTILPAAEKGTPAPDAARVTPTMIEWDQPEDDIPSMEDVLEVLRDENAIDLPILTPKDADIHLPAMSAAAEDVIPKVVWLGEGAPATSIGDWPVQKQPDDQFITKVDVRRTISDEPDIRSIFLPNNLAIGSGHTNTGALMLAGYSAPSGGGSQARYRSHLIASGLVMLAALGLFASGLLTDHIPGSRESERVSADPVETTVTDKGMATAIPASQRKPPKATREPAKLTETAKTTRTKPPTPERPAATRSQNNRKTTQVASNERQARSKARPAKTPVALLTRPRVVRNY